MRLAAFVLGLSLLTPLADRGLRVMRVETVAAAGLMVLNLVSHAFVGPVQRSTTC
jgi:hypothetical protein